MKRLKDVRSIRTEDIISVYFLQCLHGVIDPCRHELDEAVAVCFGIALPFSLDNSHEGGGGVAHHIAIGVVDLFCCVFPVQGEEGLAAFGIIEPEPGEDIGIGGLHQALRHEGASSRMCEGVGRLRSFIILKSVCTVLVITVQPEHLVEVVDQPLLLLRDASSGLEDGRDVFDDVGLVLEWKVLEDVDGSGGRPVRVGVVPFEVVYLDLVVGDVGELVVLGLGPAVHRGGVH